MENHKTVDNYIDSHPHWKEELTKLRDVFNSTELEEDVKWGAPAYVLNGKIVSGLGAFKNHIGIWFHQGVFLKDKQKQLVNAQEGKTKALRQWRFEKGDNIDTDLVRAYAQEAIENSSAGMEIKPVRAKKTVVLHPLLKDAFGSDTTFKTAYDNLTPGKKREYAEYVSEAKREATQLSRIEKIIPMIKDGQGLHDKYKNC